MIERAEYLKKCQTFAVLSEGRVMYQGMRFYPYALKIWFTPKGETRNTAILKDSMGCIVECRLEEVEDIHE